LRIGSATFSFAETDRPGAVGTILTALPLRRVLRRETSLDRPPRDALAEHAPARSPYPTMCIPGFHHALTPPLTWRLYHTPREYQAFVSAVRRNRGENARERAAIGPRAWFASVNSKPIVNQHPAFDRHAPALCAARSAAAADVSISGIHRQAEARLLSISAPLHDSIE